MSAVLALGSCGGGRSPETPVGSPQDHSEVRGVVAAYFRAVDGNDGRRMCGALTAELRLYVARLQQTSCAKALEAESRRLPESPNGYRIRDVRIDGNRAMVSLGGVADGARMQPLRVRSSWQIASASGAGA